MIEKEVLEWFARLAKGWNPDNDDAIRNSPHDTLSVWVPEAESAIASVFAAAHPIRSSWERSRKRAQGNPHYIGRPLPELAIVSELLGIVVSAERILREGRLRAFADEVRVETVGECLDVAAALLDKGEVIAATVLAGGALEVHLLHLCKRFGVTWNGNDSISAYNDALSRARNVGTLTISASDSKSVTAWGARRNDAAHSPTTFNGTVEEVRLIVEGIRQFIARTQ